MSFEIIPNLLLRPVALDDIAALQAACWPDQKLADVQLRVHSIISAAGARERAWAYIATIDGEIVGFGQMTRWGTRGEISNLIVHPEWRSKGIGTTLIRRLLGVARENELTEVEIGVAESNPRAMSLYRRLGFRNDRRLTLDIGSGMEPVRYMMMSFGRGICEA
jgi:ribosomal protein S18 acetylase RimI-like enzyme